MNENFTQQNDIASHYSILDQFEEATRVVKAVQKELEKYQTFSNGLIEIMDILEKWKIASERLSEQYNQSVSMVEKQQAIFTRHAEAVQQELQSLRTRVIEVFQEALQDSMKNSYVKYRKEFQKDFEKARRNQSNLNRQYLSQLENLLTEKIRDFDKILVIHNSAESRKELLKSITNQLNLQNQALISQLEDRLRRMERFITQTSGKAIDGNQQRKREQRGLFSRRLVPILFGLMLGILLNLFQPDFGKKVEGSILSRLPENWSRRIVAMRGETFTMRILNGTRKSQLAAKTLEKLKPALEASITKFEIGDTRSKDYSSSVLIIPRSAQYLLSKIQQQLHEEELEIFYTEGKTLILILGKNAMVNIFQQQ